MSEDGSPGLLKRPGGRYVKGPPPASVRPRTMKKWERLKIEENKRWHQRVRELEAAQGLKDSQN